jgi:hypothetical protein
LALKTIRKFFNYNFRALQKIIGINISKASSKKSKFYFKKNYEHPSWVTQHLKALSQSGYQIFWKALTRALVFRKIIKKTISCF